MANCKKHIQIVSTKNMGKPLTKLQKIKMFIHNIICKNCRNFSKNDEKLDEILKLYKNDKINS